MSPAKRKMAVEEAFEFETGVIVVVGKMEGTDRPVVDVPAVLELDGREAYEVRIVSIRMPGPRSKPSSIALELDGVPAGVVPRIRSGSHATLSFDF
ncbi:MAG TPA: hypothetical protein DFS52_30985 [Myxococcales bacterium]|jgi:hypothetical protein|nr:hypothetical protein [Myxococcales bacterium]